MKFSSQSKCFFSGLLFPGLGHAFRGKWFLAMAFPCLETLLLVIALQTRAIALPNGINAFALILLAIHLLSAVSAYIAPPIRQGRISWVKVVSIALTPAGAASILFFLRAPFFDLDLHYIATQSMSPTLNPGDIIVVDLAAYESTLPAIGDIVTFRLNDHSTAVIVKRVERIHMESERFYLAGDNPGASFDSRYFGTIKRQDIFGKVILTI